MMKLKGRSRDTWEKESCYVHVKIMIMEMIVVISWQEVGFVTVNDLLLY